MVQLTSIYQFLQIPIKAYSMTRLPYGKTPFCVCVFRDINDGRDDTKNAHEFAANENINFYHNLLIEK